MKEFITSLQASLGAADLANRFAEWLPDFLAAVLILIGFYIVWHLVRRAANAVIQRAQLDSTAASFVQTVLRYILMTIGIVTALGKVGINTASILTSLGVAGLTIGFAAKDALSNMISGLFIFWDRPFVIGDLVEIGGYYGRVDNITMRSTRVVTPDGKMLAIPNSIVVNTTVSSYTNFRHLRLDVALTIGTGESFARVRKVALAVAHELSGVMLEPEPKMVVKTVNDYNFEIEVQAWLDDETQHIAARHSLRESLVEAFNRENIEMPFETLALRPVNVTTTSATA